MTLVERLWQTLLDKDDRTSPEEYPDYALIDFNEFKEYANEIAADAITRLTTLNEGYKGQVEYGASEIARLEGELARRTIERDYHLKMADMLADKVPPDSQPKRPVAFRVRRSKSSEEFELFSDEEGAQAAASDRGVDYEGLYLVGDRLTAELAQARKREVKVRWETTQPNWSDLFAGALHIGYVLEDYSGHFKAVHIPYAERSGRVILETTDESSARSAVEARALKAITGEPHE